MGQKAKLLSYLEQHHSVTQLEAFNALGICRLSERVRELQALDYDIHKEWVTVPSRDGTAKVKRYTLVPKTEACTCAENVDQTWDSPTHSYGSFEKCDYCKSKVSGRQAALSPAQPPSPAVPPIFV